MTKKGTDTPKLTRAQSRSRIFISCAAPGLVPLPEPPQTHGHPEDVKGGSLGKTANGLTTSARYLVPTPFQYISAEKATCDLPRVTQGLLDIAYPDHRESKSLSVLNRVLVSCIPRCPGGAGILTASARGLIPKPQIKNFDWSNPLRAGKTSTAWSRVRRTKLFPTIMTEPRPDDGVNGRALHWDEHRLLTILEARRAQGFLDQDVILGSISDQWKIVGNSVARPVALALGMAMREAWLASTAPAPSANTRDKGSLSSIRPLNMLAGLKQAFLQSYDDGNSSSTATPRSISD